MKKCKLITFITVICILLLIISACSAQVSLFENTKRQEIIRKQGAVGELYINSFSFNGSIYVAVASIMDEQQINISGAILTSEDGLLWKELNISHLEPLYDVKWCDNKFIAVGGRYFSPSSNYSVGNNGEVVYTSYDGVQWNKQEAINSFMPFYKIEWNGQICVAIGGKFAEGEASGIIAYSKDGVKWQAVGNPPYYIDENDKKYYDNQPLLNDVKFINDRFIAVGQEVLISEDGVEWKSVKQDHTDNIIPYFCIGSNDNKIFIVGERKIYCTVDFNNWQEVVNDTLKDNYKQIICNGKYYLLYGNTIEENSKTVVFKSDNLIKWKKINGPVFSINNMLWDGEKYLIGSNQGIYSSIPNAARD